MIVQIGLLGGFSITSSDTATVEEDRAQRLAEYIRNILLLLLICHHIRTLSLTYTELNPGRQQSMLRTMTRSEIVRGGNKPNLAESGMEAW
jgi:hypothetical protein